LALPKGRESGRSDAPAQRLTDAHGLQGPVPRRRHGLLLRAEAANVAGAAPDLSFGVGNNVGGIAVVEASAYESFEDACRDGRVEAEELEARCALEIVGEVDCCSVRIV
jgi:hypothetical protein